MGPIVNQSTSPADALTGPGTCGDGSTALPGIDSSNPHAQGRCGYGPRLPLLVVSPWARENFVDNTVTDQTSVLRFIEDNWLDGERIGGGSFDCVRQLDRSDVRLQAPHGRERPADSGSDQRAARSITARNLPDCRIYGLIEFDSPDVSNRHGEVASPCLSVLFGALFRTGIGAETGSER